MNKTLEFWQDNPQLLKIIFGSNNITNMIDKLDGIKILYLKFGADILKLEWSQDMRREVEGYHFDQEKAKQ